MYKNIREEEFIENITVDIQYFVNDVSIGQCGSGSKSVLLFPPVNNYRRFLIHKICDETILAELSHFSIGHGDSRRTVVCFTKDLVRVPEPIMGIDQYRLPNTTPTRNVEDKKWKVAPAVDIYRPPAARRLSAQQAQAADIQPEKPKSKTRRPDIQVYVPRPKRLSGVGNGGDSIVSPGAMTTNCRQSMGQLSESHRLSLKQCDALPPKSTLDALHMDTITPVQSVGTKALNSNGNEAEVLKATRHSLDHNHAHPFQRVDTKCENINPESSSTNQCLNDTVSETIGSRTCIDDTFHKLPPDSSPSEQVSQVQKGKDSSISDRVAGGDELNNTNGNDNCLPNQTETIDVSVHNDVEGFRMNGSSSLISMDKCAIDEKPSEITFGGEILVSFNRKKCEDKSRNHEEQNRKNRLIHHGKVMSDVLVISDPKPMQDSTSSPMKLCDSPPDTIVKKKVLKSKDKPISVPIFEAEKSIDSTSPNFNIDEYTWDMMFDENGDCLHPHLMEELTSKVGKVTIKTPRSDYKSFVTRAEFQPQDEFSHVVEIYNFSSEFKTQDLVNIFSAYKDKGFEIKWVDDTHALAVFSSPIIAADVLSIDHPFVKTRPLHEATAESRTKARRSSEFLRPYRARPETCPALARRLVTGALGVRLKTAKQEREAEKVLLSQAREKKRLEARQKDDAWEGILGSN